MSQWIVCVQKPDPTRLEFWGAYDNSADDQAHVPFTEDVARGIAADINADHLRTGLSAMAYPLIETLQPGV